MWLEWSLADCLMGDREENIFSKIGKEEVRKGKEIIQKHLTHAGGHFMSSQRPLPLILQGGGYRRILIQSGYDRSHFLIRRAKNRDGEMGSCGHRSGAQLFFTNMALVYSLSKTNGT
ncbi:hypothetical protein TNCT_336911 [Trichonephila clavata]|uniref:Uncharacterized protein n=1 Tax=Trichonephila clavata TaxID=2740835 RepID=A0A8X6L5G9_TRICU|nr:hypothetical protein TNCT_336911 [Trichonephila clavata]